MFICKYGKTPNTCGCLSVKPVFLLKTTLEVTLSSKNAPNLAANVDGSALTLLFLRDFDVERDFALEV